MDNVIRISIGDLGSCGGGDVSQIRHDSTCSCEGCHEHRLAERDFELVTGPVFSKDNGGVPSDKDVIVIGDDDVDSVSDIFEIGDDIGNDDDGFCDDGVSDLAYSEFSPIPYDPKDDDDLGLNELEVESDTPDVVVVDGVIGDKEQEDDVIEAHRKDKEQLEKLVKSIDDDGSERDREMGTYLVQEQYKAAKFWKLQIELFELKMMQMDYKVTMLCDGMKAAKRVHEYGGAEIKCLQELVMAKTEEANKKDEQMYKMAGEMCKIEK